MPGLWRKVIVLKVYSGKLVKGRREVRVRSEAGTAPLRCLDFCTPTFAWGYHGGASEELAIAILHEHLGSPDAMVGQRVLRLFRAFTDEIVANFDRDNAWSINENAVAKWIRDRERVAVPAGR
jgi:hypothetical protein